MGAWGTGIFQDDTACDVRDLYLELASLGLEPARIRSELDREYGKADGIDESTFWVALALTQHKNGRLDADTKKRALHFIDTGRALADWAELTEPGDPTIKARGKQLEKVKATLASPQPKAKKLKPSAELLARVDRPLVDFPWRKDALYAYHAAGSWFAFATTATGQITLPRQYVSTPKGYALAPRPLPRLTQANLVLLQYRGEKAPSAAQARKLRPWLRASTKSDRAAALKSIEATRAVWAKSANRTFEEFSRETREMLASFTPTQLRARYEEVRDHGREQLARLEDREAAIDRCFQRCFSISPREAPPVERLVDLGVEARFDADDDITHLSWTELDAELANLKT